MHLKQSFRMHGKKLIQLKEETEIVTIIAGHFNTPLSGTSRTRRQKLCKDIEELNNKLTGIYRTLHPTTEHTFMHLFSGHSPVSGRAGT